MRTGRARLPRTTTRGLMRLVTVPASGAGGTEGRATYLVARVPADAPALDNRQVAPAYVAGPYGTSSSCSNPNRTTGILPISLIGMPGGGKSTVGKEVARRLGWRFADCDKEIERRQDARSPRCSAAMARRCSGISKRQARPIDRARSVGNRYRRRRGAPQREPRAVARTNALRVPAREPRLLWRRVRRDRRRPLLQVADPQRRLRELSAEREPLYQETAHIVVDTEGMCSIAWSVNSVARSERPHEHQPDGDRARGPRRAQLPDPDRSARARGREQLRRPAARHGAVIVTNPTVAPLYADRWRRRSRRSTRGWT